MIEKKEEVISWIKSGRDYNTGIGLLVRLSGKPKWINFFTGKQRSLNEKLAYEILVAAQMADVRTWKNVLKQVVAGCELEDIQPVIRNHKPQILIRTAQPETNAEPETIEIKPLLDYPPIIRRVIYEYASLFQERSKMHLAMCEMPESNAEAVMLKRAEMFDIVKALSARLELLWETRKAFDEKGIIPEEKYIFPDLKKDAPVDINELDEIMLKKQKKNLQSGNSKDQALLDYQSKEHKEVKNPMPNGPKRTKIEMRIAERNKEIEKLETALLKYVVKG